MENSDLKVFKLLYSGEIKEQTLESGNLVDIFSNFSVLAFYIGKNKRLYTWIGEDASRTLKNYIVNMRQAFSEEYPYMRVLRYITEDSIESMSENDEFFSDIGILKENIVKHLELEKSKYEEELQTKINNLKEEADSFFENENFEKAIEISKTIIELAKETQDKKLIEDQEAFISEAEARMKAKFILTEIREESKKIKKRYLEAKKNNIQIKALYNYVQTFKKNYEQYLTLPALETIQRLILNVEELWSEYFSKIKKQDQIEEDMEIINSLREKGKDKLNKGSLSEAHKYFEKITVKINKLLKKTSENI